MNITLPERNKISKRRILIYSIAILVCIIAIIIVVMVQILGKDVANSFLGIHGLTVKTEEEENLLKANFDTIFNNNLEGEQNLYNISKIDEEKELVYTGYEKQETVTNSYEINVNIPYFNIDNSVIQSYNEEIKGQFQEFTEIALNSESQNIIYTVEYQAYIENDILSVIIRSNLKRGASAQRVIVLTYNYDLIEQKELSLDDMIEKFELNKNEIQSKIRKEIKEEEQKSQDLKDLGYEIYTRDSQSDLYLIENSKEFFMHNQNLYIIYAYGNESFTSEMDLVVI